jgi:hypothetical protein
MQPFAPLGRCLAHRGQTCSYSPGDTPDTDCPASATWHILWTADLDAGLACDPHMTVARERFVFVDSHHVGPDCAMPGAHWDFDSKRCVYPDEPAVETATAGRAAVKEA